MTWSWQSSEIDQPESWLPVPRDLDAEDRGEWAANVILALKSEWGTEWRDEFVAPIALVLDAFSASRRAGDGPAYLCWPAPVPVCFAVTVNVFDSHLVPDWSRQGYDVRSYETEQLGPGIQCSAERRGCIAGQEVDLVSTVFVFDDGVSSVIIEVDEVPAMVAPFVNPDVQRFVASVALTRPDGKAYRAEPSRQLLTEADDGWRSSYDRSRAAS